MSGRPEPDFQRYLDALRELGLEPGASIADIRKAHKAMLRTCHPDWFPDDAEKAAQSGRVNAARDTLEAMSKAGDSATLCSDGRAHGALAARSPALRSPPAWSC